MPEIVEILKTGANLVSLGFDAPDSDWTPIVIAKTPHGAKMTVPIITGDKDSSFDGVGAWLRSVAAEEAAMLVSSWAVVRGDPGTLHGPVCDQPDRQEVLVVFYVGKDSTHMETAPITRDIIKPPTLGPWSGAGFRAEGRAVNALRAGISA